MTSVVLLPGMDGTSAFFRPFVAHRPPHVDVRTVEYTTAEASSYESLVDHVVAALPDDDFFILGWSFSGPLAVMLASRQLPRLRGIILVASFARRPIRFLPSWSRVLARPGLFSLYPMASMAQARLLGYATPELRVLQAEAFAQAAPHGLAARVQMLLSVDVREQLRSCPLPVLYVRATNDRVIHRGHGQMIVEHAPHATLVDVPGPHLCLATHPIEAWRAIGPFLDAHARE